MTGSERPERERLSLRFPLVFLTLAGTLLLLYSFPYAPRGVIERGFDAYLQAYARVAGGLLWIFDREVHVDGATILGRYSLWIVKDCDAMDVTILLTAAVLTFPTRWSHKAVGLLAGVAAVFLANLGRIMGLYWVGVLAPASFELAHREVFPLLMVAFTTLLFLCWVRWTRGHT